MLARMPSLIGKGGRRLMRVGETLIIVAAVAGLLGAIAFFTVPRVLGWQGVIVLTGSMEPALKTGGLAFVDQGIDAEDIKVGDIITYRDPQGAQRNITHRVIAVKVADGQHIFETQGDANNEPDPVLVPESVLVGRVALHVPEVGNASNWLRKRENLYMLLWFPAGLVIAGELIHIFKDLRKKDLQGQKEAAS